MERQIEQLLRGGKFQRFLEGQIQQIRNKYGLKKVDIEILFCLANNSSNNTAGDICRYLTLNKGHVSASAEMLCKKGYLVALPDEDDRRYVHYYITGATADIMKEVKRVWDYMDEVIFDGVTEEERAVLRSVAKKIDLNIAKVQ